MGNKNYGYEIRINDNENNNVAFVVEEAVAENLIKKIIILFRNITYLNIDQFSIKIKKKIFLLNYSGIIIFFFVKIIIFLYEFLLLSIAPEEYLSRYRAVSNEFDIKIFVNIFLFWSYYRLIKNIIYRQPYKESKKRRINIIYKKNHYLDSKIN